MFSVKKFKIVSFFSIMLIVFSFGVCKAQNSSQNSISIVFPWFSEHEDPGKIIYKKLTELLKTNGFQLDNLARFAVIIIPVQIPESETIIISYLFARSLPETIMKFNKENETAFLTLENKQDLPQEGRVIREYITEEKLVDYRKINYGTYCNTIITNSSKLEGDIQSIADQIKSIYKRNN